VGTMTMITIVPPTTIVSVTRARRASASGRRKAGDYSSLQAVTHELPEEVGKGHDVLPYTRLLQGGYVGVAALHRHHGPWVATCGQHYIHEESANTAITIHIRVDINKDKMAEHDPD
jgi:hypothetical protein